MNKLQASEIIADPLTGLERIQSKYNDYGCIVSPIGINCYSSFLAKSLENYMPSIFGFRIICQNFVKNYLDSFEKDSHFTFLQSLGPPNQIDLLKYAELDINTGIHSLRNPFGVFHLNHDGGRKIPRPYTDQVISTEVYSRLAYLDLVTYAYLHTLKPSITRIIVFSGTKAQKDAIVSSIKATSSKFLAKNIEILYLNIMPLRDGTNEPLCVQNQDQIDLQLYNNHKNYGNVAANWLSMQEKIVSIALSMIQSKVLPII